MLDYKKIHKDIRYIVRNGQSDLRVLVKRISEGHNMPYRELNIHCLGDISPLKPRCPVVEEEVENVISQVDEDGFQKTKISKQSLWRQKISERQEIFKYVTDFLDGFDQAQSN